MFIPNIVAGLCCITVLAGLIYAFGDLDYRKGKFSIFIYKICEYTALGSILLALGYLIYLMLIESF